MNPAMENRMDTRYPQADSATQAQVAHICRRIAASTVDLTPFPHLVVDDLLPPDVFDQLVTSLPSPDSLTAVSTMGWRSVQQYGNRSTALVSDLDEPRHLWQMLNAALCDISVQDTLQTMFSPHVQEARNRLDVRRELRLDCACDGSGLRPHTDAPILFMKSLVYVAAAKEDPSLDTILYVPRDPASRHAALGASGDYTDDTYTHEDPADHIPHTRVQFRPNRLLTFPRTRDSLHGLKPQDAETGPRYVLSLHYKHNR